MHVCMTSNNTYCLTSVAIMTITSFASMTCTVHWGPVDPPCGGGQCCSRNCAGCDCACAPLGCSAAMPHTWWWTEERVPSHGTSWGHPIPGCSAYQRAVWQCLPFCDLETCAWSDPWPRGHGSWTWTAPTQSVPQWHHTFSNPHDVLACMYFATLHICVARQQGQEFIGRSW